MKKFLLTLVVGALVVAIARTFTASAALR